MKASVFKVNHRNLGTISVKVDAEDKHILAENKPYIKVDNNASSSRVAIQSDGVFQYASRVILDEHGMLDSSKNVFHKDGDSFNLTKKNLFQIA